MALSSWSGVLPGPRQSNSRAELYAIYQPLLIPRDGFLYTDSSYCLAGLWKLQRREWIENEWSTCCHYNLWLHIAHLLHVALARWEFIKVKSRQKHSAAHSPWTSWTILHNDAADAAAKAVNKHRPLPFLQVYVLADLQTKVSALSKEACTVAAPAALPVQDRFQLQLDRLGMLGDDRAICLPAAVPKLELQYLALHAPFAAILRDFLLAQKWVPDSFGFSVLELYVFFTDSTGWMVPINICGMENSLRPPGRSKSAQACWAHETDWNHFALLRQPLNVQCRTILFVLRDLFRHMQLPWEITLQRCLHCMGHQFPVQTLAYRPTATCDGIPTRKLRSPVGWITGSLSDP